MGDPALPIVSFNGDNADKNIVQLLINVTGTIINSTEAAADKDKNGNTVCKDKVTCEKSVKSYYGNNLSIADLIDPADKTIHACLTSDISAEEELGCQEMTDKKLSSFFGGTSKYVNKTLFGIDQAGAIDISSVLTSGIVYKIQHGETLDNTEIKFLNNTDIPFLAYLLHRGMSDRGHCCALPSGCTPLHFLSDHRVEGGHSGRVPAAHRQPDLRLRRLPAGVSMEPFCPPFRRAGLHAAARA